MHFIYRTSERLHALASDLVMKLDAVNKEVEGTSEFMVHVYKNTTLVVY